MEAQLYNKIKSFKDSGYTAHYIAKECNCSIGEVMQVWHPQICRSYEATQEYKESLEVQKHKQVIDLYESGLYSQQEIGGMIALSMTTINKIVRGLPETSRESHLKGREQKTEAKRQEFFKLFANHLGPQEIAERMNCSIATVRNMRKQFKQRVIG